MNSLWTGSTWLLTTAAALSPLIALLIGFAGTDRLLRWQLAEKRDRASLKGAEGCASVMCIKSAGGTARDRNPPDR